MSDKNNYEKVTENRSEDDKNVEVNVVRYVDKGGKDNYVYQEKVDGKERVHITRHSDGSSWKTNSDGSKERIK